mmetsp:Transcript_29095/g.28120  ORF Transcript_29095/g.28120 Transcript_29095/m.28120 type:complete len:154 (+) Transcript_29095:1148-1609(+)
MFITNSDFDKAMIYFIRSIAKNFLKIYQERSFNGLPLGVAILADADTLDDYIDNILMKMQTDAQGPLLYIMPIVMRINIYIVNIDTSKNQKQNLSKPKFNVEECKADLEDISLKAFDNLNLHDYTLYVLRKDGHYDAIYFKEQKQFKDIARLS